MIPTPSDPEREDSVAGSGRRLLPCPSSPNCVSSEADDSGHAVDPMRLLVGPEQAWEALGRVVAGMPRTVVVERSGDYLHAEVTSRLFRFVDDLEFVLQSDKGTIGVRSASRVGYSDLGVNRRRVEEIRRRLRELGVIQ